MLKQPTDLFFNFNVVNAENCIRKGIMDANSLNSAGKLLFLSRAWKERCSEFLDVT